MNIKYYVLVGHWERYEARGEGARMAKFKDKFDSKRNCAKNKLKKNKIQQMENKFECSQRETQDEYF